MARCCHNIENARVFHAVDRFVEQYLKENPDLLFVSPKEIALIYVGYLNPETFRPYRGMLGSDQRKYVAHIQAAGRALRNRGYERWSKNGYRNAAVYFNPLKGGPLVEVEA